MKPRPKDWFFGSYLLHDSVSEVLQIADEIAAEAKDSRKRVLLEHIAQVRSLQKSGNADRIGAACFHLGVATSETATFKGRQPDQREVAFARKLVISKRTNREIRAAMAAEGFPERSEKVFNEWIRRRVRKPLAQERRS